jgi:hypothetical protein
MKQFLVACLCATVCLSPARGQSSDQKQQTVLALQGLQAKDGGFLPVFAPGSKPAPKSSLRATTSALRALKYMGGEPKDKEACLVFVERCFDKKSGGFADHPDGKPDVTTTAVGIMAVVELKMPVNAYRKQVVKYLTDHVKTFDDIRIAAAGLEAVKERPPEADAWLEQIARMRNEDGTYGRGDGVARATGGAVAAVLRLGGEVPHRDNVIRALKAGQRSDGGFGQEGKTASDLESSYRITRCFVMLKEKPNVERLLAFVATCRNSDGGYGVSPGQPSTVGATYYAAIIQHWLAEK